MVYTTNCSPAQRHFWEAALYVYIRVSRTNISLDARQLLVHLLVAVQCAFVVIARGRSVLLTAAYDIIVNLLVMPASEE